jgi:DNA-binding MarR family transcriptional regulator
MSRQPEESGLSTDDAIRALLLLMPRLVGRAKRLRIPDELQSLALAPRHLSLLAYLLFDGPMTVNDLAKRLEIAPTTVSLMVGELSRKGVLERHEDDDDRRRRIVSITAERQPAIRAWLARGATAWREALGPLTPAERRTFVATLLAYEKSMEDDEDQQLPQAGKSAVEPDADDGQAKHERGNSGAGDHDVRVSVQAHVNERIGVPVDDRTPDQGVPEPHHRKNQERAEVGRSSPAAGTENQPADDHEQRDDDVQQPVSQQIRAVQMQQRTQEEPVHDTAPEDDDHRVQPQGAPDPAVANRVHREGRGGRGGEHIAPDRQVAEETDHPGAQVRPPGDLDPRLGVAQVLMSPQHEDELQDDRERGDRERRGMEQARASTPARSHRASLRGRPPVSRDRHDWPR